MLFSSQQNVQINITDNIIMLLSLLDFKQLSHKNGCIKQN